MRIQTAVAQWICLRLPSCLPGFESQARHLCSYQFKFELWHVEKTKINRKRGRNGPFEKNIINILHGGSKRGRRGLNWNNNWCNNFSKKWMKLIWRILPILIDSFLLPAVEFSIHVTIRWFQQISQLQAVWPDWRFIGLWATFIDIWQFFSGHTAHKPNKCLNRHTVGSSNVLGPNVQRNINASHVILGQNKFVKRSSNAHKDDEHLGDIFKRLAAASMLSSSSSPSPSSRFRDFVPTWDNLSIRFFVLNCCFR